jgi:hypothetical protein
MLTACWNWTGPGTFWTLCRAFSLLTKHLLIFATTRHLIMILFNLPEGESPPTYGSIDGSTDHGQRGGPHNRCTHEVHFPDRMPEKKDAEDAVVRSPRGATGMEAIKRTWNGGDPETCETEYKAEPLLLIEESHRKDCKQSANRWDPARSASLSNFGASPGRCRSLFDRVSIPEVAFKLFVEMVYSCEFSKLI